MRASRRVALAAAAAVLPLAGLTATASVAGAQEEDGEPRVRELTYRVRDLEYRWRSLDDSERVDQSADQTTIAFAADVLFAYDQADLTPEAQQRLQDVVDQLDELGGRTVSISGHTDDHGDPAYNQDLSLRRAEAVRAMLDAALGDGYTFEVAGHGETQPVAPNQNEDGSDNPQGRALNRRVEISFPTA